MNGRSPDILYVITDLEIGGVPLHLQRLALAMRERAFHVEVVSLKAIGSVGESLQQAGVEVLACEGRGGWDFRVIGRLAELIRRKRPGLIHSLLFHANQAARWAARQAEFPPERILCEIQTVEVERGWHLWVDRATWDGCRLTIGNSPSVIAHLENKARIPRDRLRLIRGGIDPSIIQAAAPADKRALGPGIHADTPVVLWVGRLDPVKGLDTLVRAFKSVAAQSAAHLLLVGGGPIRERIVRDSREQGLADRVHLLGPRNDVPGLLQCCDVFAFPSRTEGLPNALLEAMAVGCPIVATDVPGCRDLIHHRHTGLLVPYGDTQALADSILTLLSNRSLAAELGRGAQHCVETKWHAGHTFDAYAALYKEVQASFEV